MFGAVLNSWCTQRDSLVRRIKAPRLRGIRKVFASLCLQTPTHCRTCRCFATFIGSHPFGCHNTNKTDQKGRFDLWRTQRDSNLQSLPSEGNALSSYAMGACSLYYTLLSQHCQHKIIKIAVQHSI